MFIGLSGHYKKGVGRVMQDPVKDKARTDKINQ